MKHRQKTITFQVCGDAPYADWDPEVDVTLGEFLEACNVRDGDTAKIVVYAPTRKPTPEQQQAKKYLKKQRAKLKKRGL